MFNNARNDNFYVAFPKVFFPDFVIERYLPLITATTNAHVTIHDFINWSIQKITIPNANYEAKEQAASMPAFADEYASKEGYFRDAVAYTDLFEHEFTVTLKAMDGNINYFIMLETFFYWYSFPNTQIHALDLNVTVSDNSGNALFRVEYGNTLYTGISQFDLDKTSPAHDLKTFDCTFKINSFNLHFIR
jgi:hypothetical protein